MRKSLALGVCELFHQSNMDQGFSVGVTHWTGLYYT